MFLMCACVYVDVTLTAQDRKIEIDGDRESTGEFSVFVCMVILGLVSNNHTALNGKATQEGG